MQLDSSGKGKPIYWLFILGVFYVSEQLRTTDNVVQSVEFVPITLNKTQL